MSDIILLTGCDHDYDEDDQCNHCGKYSGGYEVLCSPTEDDWDEDE